jgi:hypothetical protein
MSQILTFWTVSVSLYFSFVLGLYTIAILSSLEAFHPAKIFILASILFLLLIRFILHHRFPKYFSQHALPDIKTSATSFVFLAASISTQISFWLFPGLSEFESHLLPTISNFQAFTGLAIVVTTLLLFYNKLTHRSSEPNYQVAALIVLLTGVIITNLHLTPSPLLLKPITLLGQLFFISSPIFFLRVFFFSSRL